ncbi:MAG: hypothetical protein BroJett013_26110 [Alphaproteobacteria bacterium]|nr:MAG: hypothetical protein BroJett013_26110 [Alphaproteobacteria bacterium]
MTARTAPDEICARRDLSARTVSFVAIWVVPGLIAGAVALAPFPQGVGAAAWAIALAWMGGACVINARRCGRLHCYFSGPILIAGAALAGARSVGITDLAPLGLVQITSATLLLAALTWGVELVWGRHTR